MVLIDTDVLIWFIRGHAGAQLAISKQDDWCISAVTYMELLQGCKNKTELKKLQRTFHSNPNTVLPLLEGISHSACELVTQHALSHSLQMADALIAATALEHGLPLLTGNVKHFKPVAGLELIAFKP